MADFDDQMTALVRGIAAMAAALLAAARAFVAALLWLAAILTEALTNAESLLRRCRLQFAGKVGGDAPKSEGSQVTVKDEATTTSPAWAAPAISVASRVPPISVASPTLTVSAASPAPTVSVASPPPTFQLHRPWALEARGVEDEVQQQQTAALCQ